jgi:hypothetical protein
MANFPPNTFRLIRRLFPAKARVDMEKDPEGNVVVGVIYEGVEYAFHLADIRNAD